MENTIYKRSWNIICLLAAAFLLAPPSSRAAMPSGGAYQLESSVVDNGGGGKLEGGEYSLKSAIGQNILPANIGLLTGGEYANRTGFYNPPHLTYQAGLPAVCSMSSGNVVNALITLPANSVAGKDVFDITLSKDPAADQAAVDAANSKMVHNEGAWSQLFSNNLSVMTVFDEQDVYTSPLANRGMISLRYKDDNNDGLLDGSGDLVRVDSLNAWSLDKDRNSWALLPVTEVDKTSKMVTVYFDEPGVYALLGAAVQTISSTFKAYPVPFQPYGPNAGNGQGQTGTEAEGITFLDVPQTGRIEIYTLDGRLVKKIPLPPTGNFIKWDVKTASGARAASGVYIWRVVSESGTKTGKLMVIW